VSAALRGFAQAAVFGAFVILVGCGHGATKKAGDDRVWSQAFGPGYACSLRRGDDTVFTWQHKVKETAKLAAVKSCQNTKEAAHLNCNMPVFCKPLNPKKNNLLRCAVPADSSGEKFVGLGATAEEAKDSMMWECIQNSSYTDCGPIYQSVECGFQ
jgi:hypothetical protein